MNVKGENYDYLSLMPHEIKLEIFEKLDENDLASLACVSKALSNAAQDPLLVKNKLPERYYQKITQAFKTFDPSSKSEFLLKNAVALQYADSVNLTGITVTKEIIDTIRDHCPNIEHIVLPENFSDEDCVNLQQLPNLKTLILCGNTILTDKGLASLNNFPNLAKLDLSWCRRITDNGLASLNNFPNLAELNLSSCKQITDAGLLCIKDLKNLTHLNLKRCIEITDAGLLCIRDLKNLTHLNLKGCFAITDDSLLSIKDLKNLIHLNLRWCSEITDAGLLHLKDMDHLTHLNLMDTWEITDAGITAAGLEDIVDRDIKAAVS